MKFFLLVSRFFVKIFELNEENIRGFLKMLKKETKTAIKENGRIIDITEDLK